MPTPTPAVDALANLPLGFWENLPFLVCGTFLLISIFGTLIIIRKNRQIEAERASTDSLNQRNSDL